ncbi:MAG: hypothetical protein ACK47B_27870 [Armatimonadota bacterium]
MRANYAEVFSLELAGEPVLWLEGSPESHLVQVSLRTFWVESPATLTVELLVPTVREQRFPWDNRSYGLEVTLPGGAPRFCHPRLRSAVADRLAEAGAEAVTLISMVPDWEFRWEGWYDRLAAAIQAAVFALSESRRRPTPALVRSYLQRAISELVNGGAATPGLPLTDPALLLRQKFELELGYPEAPDLQLKEALKAVFLREVEDRACILATGKSEVGRHVARVRPEAVRSAVTGTPVSDYLLALNPLAPFANPVRMYREGRAFAEGLRLVEPITPPLRARDVSLPEELRERMTTLTVAFADLLDHPLGNVFTPGAELARELGIDPDEEECLDGLLLTPSGARKLTAYEEHRELWPAEEFLARLSELRERDGFWYEEVPELVEVLGDGTPVYRYRYRYGYHRATEARYDKVKLAPGGLKAVTTPIPQLYARSGREEVEVDLVVAETTVLAKGARDAVLYALAGAAGLSEIDPDWSLADLQREIELALLSRGLPLDGTVPMFSVTSEGERFSLGRCLAGPLPVMRAPQTERRQSSSRKGLAVDPHLANLSGSERSRCPGAAELVQEISGFCQGTGCRVSPPL